jgi:transglutaminase-like putative cysteine protease
MLRTTRTITNTTTRTTTTTHYLIISPLTHHLRSFQPPIPTDYLLIFGPAPLPRVVRKPQSWAEVGRRWSTGGPQVGRGGAPIFENERFMPKVSQKRPPRTILCGPRIAAYSAGSHVHRRFSMMDIVFIFSGNECFALEVSQKWGCLWCVVVLPGMAIC